MLELIVCRCCLSTESGLLPVGNDFGAILDFMTSSEMLQSDVKSRVCRKCAHILGNIARFRDMCTRSDAVLRSRQSGSQKADVGSERAKLLADAQPSLSNTLCVDVSTAGDQLGPSRAAVVAFVRDIRVPRNVSEDMALVFRKDVKLEADEEANRYSDDADNDGIDDINDSFEVLIMGKYAAKGVIGQGEEGQPEEGPGGDEDLKEIKKEISEDDSAAEDVALCKLARAIKKQSVGKRKRPLPMVYIKKKRETTADSAGPAKKSQKAEKMKKSTNEPASKSFVCSKCGKLFQRPGLLKNHSCIVFTLKKDNGCGVCGRSFGSPGKLREHMLDHTGERPFSCDECGKSFKKAHILRGHLRTHLAERPYPCDLCDSSFLFEKNLQKHRKLHTGDRPHACGTCGKTFVDKTYLKRHEMIHADEITFTCDECGLSFAQLSKLNYHKLSHREERPFSCEQCGKAFKLVGQLNNHRSTHTGEKPFTCDVCGRSFRQAGNFNCHKRVHTGERPYTCGVCGNSYTEAGYLKKHKRIHTGEKPFACDVCGKAFVETCGLRRHKLVHTGEQRYSCGDCGALFKQPGGLRKHRRKHVADKLAGAAKWRALKSQDVSLGRLSGNKALVNL